MPWPIKIIHRDIIAASADMPVPQRGMSVLINNRDYLVKSVIYDFDLNEIRVHVTTD